MKPHIVYPITPVNFMPNASAMADRCPIVAMLPLSKYLNGSVFSSPESLPAISFPTYLPSCMAGCATPGRLFSATMSPSANTSGCPASEQSGCTGMRPARSTSRPAFCASSFASGDACTPAAQIRVRVRITSSPSGPLTVMLSSSMSTASVLSRTSTPIDSSLLRLYSRSFSGNGPSTAPAPSRSRIWASLVLTVR